MKTTKIFGLILMLAVLLSVSVFAADPYKIDFEGFDVGYEIAGDAMEDDFYRYILVPAKIVEKDGSKVASIDGTFPGLNNGSIRFYGYAVTSECKPVATWGKQFVFSYRFFLDVQDGATGLIFNDRITDSKDNEGFEVLRIWGNCAMESQDGQIAYTTFGEWHTITHNYDFDAKTITTYHDGELAFTQPLPDKVEGVIDWATDICYQTLGNNWGNDNAKFTIYLDDISFASGAYTPDQGGDDAGEGEGAPDTFDASIAVALVGLVAAGGTIVSKKRR